MRKVSNNNKLDLDEKVQETADFLNRKATQSINGCFAAIFLLFLIIAGIFFIIGKIGESKPPSASGVLTLDSPLFAQVIIRSILYGLPLILIPFLLMHAFRIATFKFGVFGIILLVGLLMLLWYLGRMFGF